MTRIMILMPSLFRVKSCITGLKVVDLFKKCHLVECYPYLIPTVVNSDILIDVIGLWSLSNLLFCSGFTSALWKTA